MPQSDLFHADCARSTKLIDTPTAAPLDWVTIRLPPLINSVYLQEYNAPARSRMFDAQCDFAAVVYGAGDEPDRLLLDFSERLCRSGLRVAGIVQLGRAGHAGNSNLGAVMLPGNEVVAMAHDPGSSSCGCRLHAGWVADGASIIAAAIERGVDLVIVNRFGKLEAEGQGFIDLIKQAVSADIPALIAVPEHRFAAWTRYSGGMHVRLPCRRAALDRWWQSVAGATSGRTAADTFCEQAK
jgi:hypothetical protein